MTPIFVGGTGSHVGKSWMAAAICRHLLPPAPSAEERFEALADWFERDADLGLFEEIYLQPHP